MSAEELGRRLLAEVEGEGLDEILQSLRALNEPEPSSRLGIPPLDRLVHVFEHASHPHQPQVPQETWSSSPPRAPRQGQGRKLKLKGPVVEITSAGPGAGKTHLLYLITTIAVLPATYNGILLNGKGSAVVVIDTDSRFDVERLAHAMRHWIYQQQWQHRKPASDRSINEVHDPLTQQALTSLLVSSLSHVHIFRPQSFPSLLATLAALPTYLFDPAAHPSTHRPLHSILLDSASAFFWQVRAEQDDARNLASNPERASGATGRTTGGDNPYARLVHQLRTLQRTFSCAIVATTWSLFPAPASSSLPHSRRASLGRPLLPAPWPSFVTVRLAVAREAVPPFAPAMSVEEAMANARERQEVVERGRFEAWVDGWGSEEWTSGVWDALRSGYGGFGFVIRDDGIVIEELEPDTEEAGNGERKD